MTAEEFLKAKDYNITDDGELYDGLLTNNVIKDMIEFAQLHVEAALLAASNQNNHPDAFLESTTWWIPSDSIINAYPKELIK